MEIKRLLFLMIGIILVLATRTFAQSDTTQQQFQGFNLQGYTDSGQKSWDVKGDTADILGNNIKLTNIDANMYGEDTTNLVAKSGMIDKVSGQIHLEKDVVITTESGAKLTTDSLDWKRNEDLITTDDFVTITQKKMTTTGTGIEAHPNLKLAQLNEEVTVQMEPEEDADPEMGQTVTITCDGPLEIDQIQNKATFNENVVAVQVGRELKADIMEVFFDPLTKKIKRVVCTGNVEVTQGENKSYSDQAIYSADDQKLILTGRPKLIMITEGENEMPGLEKLNFMGDKDETQN